MAFVFAQNFPFQNGPCFARANGSGSCHASAQASAGSGGACFGRGRCGPPSFGFRDTVSPCDMVNTPEAYLIYFDATGFRREDVHVKVVDMTLKLSAKQGEAVVEKAWSIPEDVLVDDITAKFINAELTISLPRVPQEPKASFDVPIETSAEATRPASPAQEPVPEQADLQAPPNDQVQDTEQDVDGSWVEVADEDVTRAKEKGKASSDDVLEDADK